MKEFNGNFTNINQKLHKYFKTTTVFYSIPNNTASKF